MLGRIRALLRCRGESNGTETGDNDQLRVALEFEILVNSLLHRCALGRGLQNNLNGISESVFPNEQTVAAG